MLRRLEIFRDKVSVYVSLIPFIFMLLNLGGYILFFYAFIHNMNMSEGLWKLFEANGHVCNASLVSLVLMLGTSKNYRFISWLSFYCLVALWAINFVYMVSSWEVDLYFLITSLIIYAIFVILTVRVLTNAKI